MSYATETEDRAAWLPGHFTMCSIGSTRASVPSSTVLKWQSSSTVKGRWPRTNGNYGEMVGHLLPALDQSYLGPRQYHRPAHGDAPRARHEARRLVREPFDPVLTHQAYIDMDNILQDLLREREQYPASSTRGSPSPKRQIVELGVPCRETVAGPIYGHTRNNPPTPGSRRCRPSRRFSGSTHRPKRR